MKKTQKILLIVSIMLLTSLLAIVAVNAETHQVAYAISNSEFSVDKYTDIPGGILGLFNYLSIDSATMTINHTALSKDIEQYGLFTYEEFSKLVSITPEVFDAFNGQYLRIAIGKGMITVEEIQTLLNKYARFFQ